MQNNLSVKDIEIIERIVYKMADDMSISIARSFERLSDRIDAIESRMYSRIGDVEEKVESVRGDLNDAMADIKELLQK